jgi:membrane-associated protease RseP (regulator of RpoE activity)
MLAIFLIVTLLTIVHVFAMALAGSVFGLPIREIALFLGPRILGFNGRATLFSLRAIPIGGHVAFGRESDDDQGLEQESLAESHPLVQTGVNLAGCLALLLLAGSLLGAERVATGLFPAAYNLIRGAVNPAIARHLIEAAHGLVRSGEFVELFGLLALTIAAFNLLPAPPLDGGNIILALCSLRSPLSLSIRERVTKVGFLLLIIFYSLWLMSLLRYAWAAMSAGV